MSDKRTSCKNWISEKECLLAIGLEHADEKLRKFFMPGTGEGGFSLFETPNDKSAWVLSHKELPQTFTDFALQRSCRFHNNENKSSTGRGRNKKTMIKNERKKIYLVPIGDFSSECSPSLDLLCQYASLYFCLPVELLPIIPIENITWRMNRNVKQLFTDDILNLLSKHLPEDALCLLGVTMNDLYPEKNWNYVLGIAQPTERVGVFSFIRYSPGFTEAKESDRKLTNDEHGILLLNSLKVMVHEIFHLFMVEHCQYFQCVMQGTNSTDEQNNHPLELCTVCLHKFHHSLQIVNPTLDLLKRYQSLLKFYKNLSPAIQKVFKKDMTWLKLRINKLIEL